MPIISNACLVAESDAMQADTFVRGDVTVGRLRVRDAEDRRQGERAQRSRDENRDQESDECHGHTIG